MQFCPGIFNLLANKCLSDYIFLDVPDFAAWYLKNNFVSRYTDTNPLESQPVRIRAGEFIQLWALLCSVYGL